MMATHETHAKPRTDRQKTQLLRRHLSRQLALELVLPLVAYYLLRSVGVRQWLALSLGGSLLAPSIIYHAARCRRIEMLPLFSLSFMVIGALMSVVTGDPRTLLIRDSWVGGLLGAWLLVTVPTERPFMLTIGRAIAIVKNGQDGAEPWAARWQTDLAFRKHLRILTFVWGAVLTLDAGIRVWIAYRLPIDSVPVVSAMQWLAILGATIGFHTFYVTKKGLKS